MDRHMLVHKMTTDLDLEFQELQDWGFVNASKERIVDFVEYYIGHTHSFTGATRRAFVSDMIEIIVESLDQALMAGPLDDASRIALDRFLEHCEVSGDIDALELAAECVNSDRELQLRGYLRLPYR